MLWTRVIWVDCTRILRGLINTALRDLPADDSHTAQGGGLQGLASTSTWRGGALLRAPPLFKRCPSFCPHSIVRSNKMLLPCFPESYGLTVTLSPRQPSTCLTPRCNALATPRGNWDKRLLFRYTHTDIVQDCSPTAPPLEQG